MKPLRAQKMAIPSLLMAFTFASSVAQGAVVVTNTSNTTSGGAGLTVSSTDLVNQGQSTLLSAYTSSTTPTFGAGTVNGGTATNTVGDAAYYKSNAGAGQLPTILVFSLNVSINTFGYDIEQIDSFAGWQNGGTETYANQKFTVEYSVVGSGAWVALTSVDYSPFAAGASNAPAYSQSSIKDSSGFLATGVDALRFTYDVPSISFAGSSGVEGLVLQEIDVKGVASIPEPSATALLGLAGLALILRRRK